MPNGVAPTGATYKIGAKGGRVSQAWQWIWDKLSTEDYMDARELANGAAEVFDILPVSVMSHLHRMAAEGHLDATTAYADVVVHRFDKEYSSRRKRMHVRLPATATAPGGLRAS